MSKMKITPDIAELMGIYIEGGNLSQDESRIVHDVFRDSQIDNILSNVEDAPSSINMEPIGSMAMDFMDDNDMYGMRMDSVIGDVAPFPGSTEWDVIQTQSDTCAIKSQQIVLRSFGMYIPEDALTLESVSKGYYVPGVGSNPLSVGDLLEDHGVGTHTKLHANVYDLAYELAQGHKVIVGVDADELWRPSIYNDLFGENANHAIVVTGIDTTNPFDIRVLVTDPGTGEVARSYPLAQFIDAWQDSCCHMIATDEAPQLAYNGVICNPEMVNFDYSLGHIPTIGNIPYDVFADNMVPRFDNYFDQQISTLHTEADFQHMFDNMDHAFDSFDNQFALNGFGDNYDDIDYDAMFDVFI